MKIHKIVAFTPGKANNLCNGIWHGFASRLWKEVTCKNCLKHQ